MTDLHKIYKEMDPRLATRESATCFLTGSRAYGHPCSFSDYDFVIDLPLEVARTLEPYSADPSDPPGSVSLRFGKLNLIIPNSPESMEVWKQGTQELCAKKPVTREVAVAHFERLRKAAGITP